MKTIKIFGKEVCSCVIVRIFLSTLAIIMLISLSSCVMPSSVRGNKEVDISDKFDDAESRKEKRKSVDEQSRDDEFAALLKEANMQNQDTSSKVINEIKTTNEDFSSLLLPLNKQVEILTNNQTDIKNKLSNIKSDVSVMKNDINEIKETLKLMSNKTTKSEIASTGFEEEENTKKPSKFTMKSDQELAKDEIDPKFVIKADSKVKASTKKIDDKLDKEEKIETLKAEKPLKNNSESLISDLNKVSFELTQSYLDNKDYSKAISKLKEIENGLTTIVEKSKHNYLLGESHYGMQQYAKAIEYFIKVLESPEFSDKENAKVMIAESQIRNGETNSAKQTFKQLIADYPESKFVPRARKMLQKL